MSVTYIARDAIAVKDTSIPPETMTIMQPTEKREGTTRARARSTRLLPVKNCPDLAWISRLRATMAARTQGSELPSIRCAARTFSSFLAQATPVDSSLSFDSVVDADRAPARKRRSA